MELLVVLLHADGAILTRDDLCAAAWDGRIVGDDAINRVLARLRRLSEGLGEGVFRLETITKVGYRLIAVAPPIAATTHDPALHEDQATPIAEDYADVQQRDFPRDPARPFVASSADPLQPSGLPLPASTPHRIDRRVILGGAALAVAAAGWGGWRWLRGGAAVDSVAVLPFANLSGDAAQAYFSDGIAEELRSALTRIVRLKVAARTSSELVRNADIPNAAVKLGVAHVVTGSVRRGAGTVRVTAQLVDGRSGLQRWSDSFDRPAGDTLGIETSIAEGVAATLAIFLGPTEKRLLTAGGTHNAVARDAYLRGTALASDQKHPLALAAFDAAVAADPDFALARAARATELALSAMNDGDTAGRAGLAAAEAEARRAVALAPDIGLPLAQLGHIQQNQLKLREAAATYAAAYARSPGDAMVLWRRADFEALMGRGSEALRLARLAQQLDPLSSRVLVTTAYIQLHTGHAETAVRALQAEMARNPGHPLTLEQLGYALIATERPAEAITVAAELVPDSWQRETIEAMATARLGDRPASDRALAALGRQEDIQYQLVEVHAQRGEIDAAFAALARAFAVRDTGLLQLKTDPLLATLRDDPRFSVMLRNIGFP